MTEEKEQVSKGEQEYESGASRETEVPTENAVKQSLTISSPVVVTKKKKKKKKINILKRTCRSTFLICHQYFQFC